MGKVTARKGTGASKILEGGDFIITASPSKLYGLSVYNEVSAQ
jgi:hypothetical protein